MRGEPLALLFLTLLAVAVVAWVIILLLRKPYSPQQWVLYFVNLLLTRVWWRAEVPDRLPLPDNQGAVIISNHRSSVDPCFFQVVARRRLIHWLVAQLYTDNPLIAWLLRTTEIIPVWRRGSDASPAKTAIQLAARGELVGMFPEGRINRTDQFMLDVRPGAVMIALKARVPILPCYLEGVPSHPIPWRPVLIPAHVRLKVGRPIDLSAYYGRQREEGVVQRLTLLCIREIARLAGRPDFQPQLAGRNWKTWQ